MLAFDDRIDEGISQNALPGYPTSKLVGGRFAFLDPCSELVLGFPPSLQEQANGGHRRKKDRF